MTGTEFLQQLLDQERAIKEQIEQHRAAHKDKTIEQIKSLMRQAGVTLGELMGRKGVKAPALYRHPIDGSTWSGRGKTPAWFDALLKSGMTREQLRIAPDVAVQPAVAE